MVSANLWEQRSFCRHYRSLRNFARWQWSVLFQRTTKLLMTAWGSRFIWVPGLDGRYCGQQLKAHFCTRDGNMDSIWRRFRRKMLSLSVKCRLVDSWPERHEYS